MVMIRCQIMDQILFNEKCRSGLDGGALDYSSQLKVSIRGKISPIMGTFSRFLERYYCFTLTVKSRRNFLILSFNCSQFLLTCFLSPFELDFSKYFSKRWQKDDFTTNVKWIKVFHWRIITRMKEWSNEWLNLKKKDKICRAGRID